MMGATLRRGVGDQAICTINVQPEMWKGSGWRSSNEETKKPAAAQKGPGKVKRCGI